MKKEKLKQKLEELFDAGLHNAWKSTRDEMIEDILKSI